MANRPNFIDLRSTSSNSVATNASNASRPLRSPRLHVAGERPPALSPLDAFAAQSRLLAKQLEENSRVGNRMSRLPPLTAKSPLILQGRSDYFRSLSHDSSDDPSQPPEHNAGLGLTTEVESPSERPMSMHPRMSRIPPTPDESVPLPSNQFKDAARGRQLDSLDERGSLYGARREQSPGDLDSLNDTTIGRKSADLDLPFRYPSPGSGHFPPSPSKHAKTPSYESTGLVPPIPLFPKRSSSIMSAPLELNNDEAMSASFHSQPARKLSSGSALSVSAIASPVAHHYKRSPSISSEASAPLPRPSFNFSRPLSRAGTPNMMDAPSRQASSDSHPSFVFADETAHTPVSMHSESFMDADDTKGAPSYIYSKYSLPRGKSLQRNSAIFLDGESSASFVWEQPVTLPSNVQTYPRNGQAPPSPPTRPPSSSSKYHETPNAGSGDTFLQRPSMERSKLSNEMSLGGKAPSPNPSRPSTSGSRPSEDTPRGRPLTSPLHDQVRGRTPMSVSTSDSASTIKPPRSQHSHAPTAAEMSAEEHLTKGIKCHEDGSVKESTYHLRLAARGGDPTGMLLYALACRHGWGMRPNQREGVEWLRKAADVVSAEIADDEDQVKDGKNVDFTDRKTRKAQFALSIYELGVSHMNGWGIEQDKALALRCFEIAGNWGDVDALAEAGFCYAQGVGCKKDLKKSAKFYRMAEAKGMSMPGNSWIHKPKYNDDNAGSSKQKKARSKSRSRGIFGKRAKDATT